MTTKEQREILEAYERGEEIEYRISLSKWYTLGSKEEFIKETGCEYKFNFSNIEYRIKKKRWRAEEGEYYFYIGYNLEVFEEMEDFCEADDECYEVSNYFKTEEEAQRAADYLKECLTKFHDNE